MTQNPRAERFFFRITLVMIAIILAGFGASALYLPEFPFPPSPLLVFHGVITLGWFVLTAIQVRLIAGRNFALHKRMGQASVALVLLIVITGYFAVQAGVTRTGFSIGNMDALGSTIFPTMDMLGFIAFYALALINRANGAAHKRLMVLAGLMMLPPASARLGITIGFEPLPGVAALVIGGSFLVYDWRTRGRPHWASVLGLIVAFGGAPLRFVIGPSDMWARIADAVY